MVGVNAVLDSIGLHRMPKKNFIPEQAYAELRKRLVSEHRFSQENIDAAYRYYVKQESLSDIAKERGISLQGLHGPMKKIWAIYNEGRDLPKDWITLEVTLPPDMASAVVQMERTALSKLKGGGKF